MQRDIVLRWIAQLSAIIARLLRRDPTMSLELARQYLEEAQARVLGPLADLIERLDVESAARLLDDTYRIYGYGQTLALRSALARASGQTREADLLAGRAVWLGREAIRRNDSPPSDWIEWVDALDPVGGGRNSAPDAP